MASLIRRPLVHLRRAAFRRVRNSEEHAAFFQRIVEARRIMRQLRERGIYKTPDGREHVACAGIFGNYLLYRLLGAVEGFPAYVVDAGGRVVAATQPTPWKSEELLDTERTLREIHATPRKQ